MREGDAHKAIVMDGLGLSGTDIIVPFCCWVTKHLLLLAVWWSWEEKGHGKELIGKIHPLLWALGNKWICKCEIGEVCSLSLYFFYSVCICNSSGWRSRANAKVSVNLCCSWMKTYWSAPFSQMWHGSCCEVVHYFEFTISLLLTTTVSCSQGQKHFLIFSKCSKSR